MHATEDSTTFPPTTLPAAPALLRPMLSLGAFALLAVLALFGAATLGA